MSEKVEKQLTILNQLYKKQDSIYHELAAYFNLSDASFWTLYAICESDQICSQHDLCNSWFYSKQTINSAINNLVKKGYIILKPIMGTRNRKSVELTQEGKAFCETSVIPLIHAECKSLMRFQEEDRKLFLSLFKQQLTFLEEEVELLMKESTKEKEKPQYT